MQNSPEICPHCRAPIPADAPGGLCPSCVLFAAAQTGDAGPAGTAPTLEEISAAFPELEIRELLGLGGMGVVFQARQPRLERLVALKILPPTLALQPGFAERFTREARALARLNHPHIVAVYDFGERAGFYYLLMEYVNGVNLRQAMRVGVTPEQALLLVPRICEALQFAHDHGVLHRDIKPENILLSTNGVPKLADFGIAKIAGEVAGVTGLTASGAQLGTAAYMAPEQIEHPSTVDHRADIYSLGVVLYEMLTGELPLGRFAAPSARSAVGPDVDDVVLRALEKERELRQQSATEMKTEVEHASADEKKRTPALPLMQLPSRDLPWSRAAMWGAALVAASIPVGGIIGAIVRSIVNPSIDSGSQLNGPMAGNIIIFGFVFGLAGTILGWKAVSDVRYHRGQLRGGGTAVFASLALPVLALLVTVFANFTDIQKAISPGEDRLAGTIVAILAVIAALIASIFAVKALWSSVHGGPIGGPLRRDFGLRGEDVSASQVGHFPSTSPAAGNIWSHRLLFLIIGLVALPFVAIMVSLIAWRLTNLSNELGAMQSRMLMTGFALLPLLIGATIWFLYRRTRPRPPAPGEAALLSPWPKRIFLLIVALVVVPVAFILLWLVVPYFAMRGAPMPTTTMPVDAASVDVHYGKPDPSAPGVHKVTLNSRTPYGWVTDFSFRIRDEKGERELPAASEIVAQPQASQSRHAAEGNGEVELAYSVRDMKDGYFRLDAKVSRGHADLVSSGFSSSTPFQWAASPARTEAYGFQIAATPLRVAFLRGLPSAAEGATKPEAEMFIMVKSRPMNVREKSEGFRVFNGEDRFEKLIPLRVRQDEAIQRTEQQLDETRARIKAGIPTTKSLKTAEMDLAIAEARGDEVKIAETRVKFATLELSLAKAEVEAGKKAPSVALEAEQVLNAARLQLEQARKKFRVADDAALERPTAR